jgi:hypothetical protein
MNNNIMNNNIMNNNTINNQINTLIEYVYKNTDNIKHLNIELNYSDETHFIEFDNIYTLDIIKNVINKLRFRNIKLIIKKKEYKKIKKYVQKNNFDRIICNCEGTCRCIEKHFIEVEEYITEYKYFIHEDINNYYLSGDFLIYGLIFCL